YSRICNYHVTDSVSLIKGRHSLKGGGEVRLVRESLSHFEPGHTTIAFSGQASHISPVADFVEGIPVVVLFFNRSQKAPMSQEVYGFFVQDDYQVSRRLVLNLGLRYELATVLESPNHALTNYSIARGLFTPGVNTDTELYNGDHNNFAPRVGFALSLTADGRSVLRGGYGIYYDNIVHTLASTLNKQNTPVPLNMISIAPRGPGKFAGMLQPSVLVPVPLPSVAYDENIKTPYAQHFNLTLQHEFGRTMVMTVGYVGSKGSKLLRLRDSNQAIYLPGVDASGKPLSTADPNNIMSRRPTQLFHLTSYPVGELDALESSVSSIYHAFQATFNKRISRGFSVLGTYTWSRSLDDESDPYGFTGDSGFPQNSYNVKADRARSIFDIAHQGSVAATYEFQFKDGRWAKGWQVNAVAIMRTGQPFSTTLGFDPTLTGRTFVRPNFVPGALINVDGQMILNRSLPIDPANGFPVGLIPGPGQDGTLGRNTFTMAGYRNLDISVAKQTQLMERLNVQARFEMFNVFNTTDLALPERRLSEPCYGKSARRQDVAGGVPGIGGGGPRGIQLSLRLAS